MAAQGSVGLEDPMMGTSSAQQGNGDGPRRIVVDALNTNQEITSSKKVQVPQEIGKKIKVMKFIARSHRKILIAMLGDRADEKNITLGDQIHNILFTAYTILRQRYNETGGTLEARTQNTSFKIMYEGEETEKQRRDILVIVEAEAVAQGIPFKKYDRDSKEAWYGIANPLLNFLSGFALRRKELRLGHHHMPIEKKGNLQKDVNLSQYGIYGVHHPLCEGVSFPPEKRASMPQTVGPVTALLCYMKAERKYSQKWESAVKRAFAHFPEIDTIMQLMRDKSPAEIRTLMSLICDVALIVTTRQATRLFAPPAAFSYIMINDHTVGNTQYKCETLLKNFNFSGHGAFAFYKVFMSNQWRLGLNKGTDSIAKQIVYHSMSGTYKEDLGVLAQITTKARDRNTSVVNVW